MSLKNKGNDKSFLLLLIVKKIANEIRCVDQILGFKLFICPCSIFPVLVSFSSAFLTSIANAHGVSVSRLEGFVSNREQSYEDPIEE